MNQRNKNPLQINGERQIFSQSAMSKHHRRAYTSACSPANLSRDVSPETSPRGNNQEQSPRGYHRDQKSAMNMSNIDTLHNLSIKEMVRQAPHSVFGIEGYVMPPVGKQLLAPRCFKWANQKNPGFIDLVCKSKSHVPSPNSYSTHLNWKEQIKGNIGVFMKKERLTTASEILKRGGLIPGPGQYEAKGKNKALSIFKTNEVRGPFTDDASFLAS